MEKKPHCSFCGSEIALPSRGGAVAGPEAFICRDCIGLCLEIIAQEDAEWREQKIELLKSMSDHLKS